VKSSLAPLSFLIVEDNPNMATIVRTVLASFGAKHMYEARSVAEAFALARRCPIDIAFIDYNLGSLDGVALVKLLRTSDDSPNPFVPIIMLTAYSEPSRVAAARDAGATEFCAKPITAAEVLRKIAEVVEHPRPFVRTETFFGPCRRRHARDDYAGPERRRDLFLQAEAPNRY
jgi:CheY-like chemotaxis protein